MFNAVSEVISVYLTADTAPIHAFPGVLLTLTPCNILSKPLAAFPHNHRRKNGQR